jgi:hypothetical protein
LAPTSNSVTTFVGDIPIQEQALKYSCSLHWDAYDGMTSPVISRLAVQDVPLKVVRLAMSIPGGGIVTTMVAVVVLPSVSVYSRNEHILSGDCLRESRGINER